MPARRVRRLNWSRPNAFTADRLEPTGPWRYALGMKNELEATRSRPPLLKRAAAVLVLVAIAALAVHFIIGLVVAVFWIAVIVAAVVAVLWAVKTVF
jgi:hypothetical protein